MADIMPPGVGAEKHAMVVSNVYGLIIQDRTIYRYDVAVTALTRQHRSFELTRDSRAEYIFGNVLCGEKLIV